MVRARVFLVLHFRVMLTPVDFASVVTGIRTRVNLTE